MKTDRNIFVPCPRCSQPLGNLAEACVSCGFSLMHLDEQVGRTQVVLEPFADTLGLITASEKRDFLVKVEKLRKRVPWLRVVVLTTHLPAPITLEEFLLWLLHRGTVAGGNGEQGVILLGIEALKHEVGIAAGAQTYAMVPQAKEKMKRLTEVFAEAMQMVSPGLAIQEILERMASILIVSKTPHETSKAPY